MKILCVSDEECPALWDYYMPGRLDEYDLIISCGDLKAAYLTFVVTLARAPVMYVHGNHDTRYRSAPPEGCESIEDKLYIHNGIRILGLGGSPHYNGGVHQYTEQQMARRIRRLHWKIRRAGGVDIIIAHAAPTGVECGDDYAHRGFDCFRELIDRYQPKYFIHGHVHMNYGRQIERQTTIGSTTVINAYERYEVEI